MTSYRLRDHSTPRSAPAHGLLLEHRLQSGGRADLQLRVDHAHRAFGMTEPNPTNSDIMGIWWEYDGRSPWGIAWDDTDRW